MTFGPIKRHRRYLLKQRAGHRALEPDGVLHLVFHSKQEDQPGNPLPAGFILTTQLATAGYTTVDDLDGATVSELCGAGFSRSEAAAILAAATNLVPAVP